MTKENPNATLKETFFGKQPNLSSFKKIGYAICVHVPKENWIFFDAKSIHCVFLGYDMLIKVYGCFEMIISKDVRFDKLESNYPLF